MYLFDWFIGFVFLGDSKCVLILIYLKDILVVVFIFFLLSDYEVNFGF